MKISDVHCHIYPAKIASKAVKSVSDFYDAGMAGDGTIEGLENTLIGYDIDKVIVHSVATKIEQVRHVNDFLFDTIKDRDGYYGFITLHPAMTKYQIESEVEWGIERGFKGVKLHPEFQNFYVDDEDVFKIYRVVSGKLPILFHTGDKTRDNSVPTRVAYVARQFPRLQIIAAHFGGYQRWNETDAYLGLDNICFDTSSALGFMPTEMADELIAKFGVDKFMFGTDFPMWDMQRELERFSKLDLDDREREKILTKNLDKLLGF